MTAKAIVFEAPLSLQVRELALAPMGPTDITVAVDFSGISTGTERLLWEGTMPPFPGLAYPLDSSSGFCAETAALSGAAIGFLRSSMFLTREKSCSYCYILPMSTSDSMVDEPVPAAII